MSTDPAHIARVMRGDFGSELNTQIWLRMTPAESAGFERRLEVNAAMDRVIDTIVGPMDISAEGDHKTGDAFGGAVQDQMDGGLIKLFLKEGSSVDVERLQALVPDPKDLEVRYQPSPTASTSSTR